MKSCSLTNELAVDCALLIRLELNKVIIKVKNNSNLCFKMGYKFSMIANAISPIETSVFDQEKKRRKNIAGKTA